MNHQVQVAPGLFLGSYPPRSETKDQPMPYAWVPWTFPGALGLSRGFDCLVIDQESTHAVCMGTLDFSRGPRLI